MPEDYRVAPDVLRKAATQLREASNCWWHARNQLVAAPSVDEAVGIVGRVAGVPDAYQTALQAALDGLARGHERVAGSARALGEVATHYENVDLAWYEQFGYIDSQQKR